LWGLPCSGPYAPTRLGQRWTLSRGRTPRQRDHIVDVVLLLRSLLSLLPGVSAPADVHQGSHLPQCSSGKRNPIAASVSRTPAVRGDRDARKAMAPTARAAASANVIASIPVIIAMLPEAALYSSALALAFLTGVILQPAEVSHSHWAVGGEAEASGRIAVRFRSPKLHLQLGPTICRGRMSFVAKVHERRRPCDLELTSSGMSRRRLHPSWPRGSCRLARGGTSITGIQTGMLTVGYSVPICSRPQSSSKAPSRCASGALSPDGNRLSWWCKPDGWYPSCASSATKDVRAELIWCASRNRKKVLILGREPHRPAWRLLHTGHVAPDSRATHDTKAVRLPYQLHRMSVDRTAALDEPRQPCFPCLA